MEQDNFNGIGIMEMPTMDFANMDFPQTNFEDLDIGSLEAQPAQELIDGIQTY